MSRPLRSRDHLLPAASQGIGWSTAEGSKWQLLAELKRLEGRGEIRVHRASMVERHGILTVRYVRLKAARTRWQRVRLPIAGTVTALGLSAGYVYVLGRSVWILLAPYWRTWGGTVLGAAALWWLATRIRHSGACPGLHCSGCRR